MSRPLAPLLFSAACLLSGCAGFTVKVDHIASPEKVPLDALPKLQRLYIVLALDPPPRPVLQGGDLKDAIKRLGESLLNSDGSASRRIDRMRAAEFLSRVAAALDTPYVDVSGYQVFRSSAEFRLPGSFQPTAVAWIFPEKVQGRQTEQRQTLKDKKTGQESTRITYELEASFRVSWKVETWPERAPLLEGEATKEVQSSMESRQDLVDWLDGLKDLTSEAEKKFPAQVAPHRVARNRSIVKGDTEASKAAYKSAENSDWPAARAAWSAELARGEGGRTPDWNLGVLEEREGHYEKARAHYASALTRDAPLDELKRYIGEIDRMTALSSISTAVYSGAGGWFDGRVAVLPFSNDSVSIPAPDRLRAKVARCLHEKGYDILGQEETDEKLRDLGVSLGEHLKTVKPRALAEALGAAKLLYGHVEEFRTVNVGVYYRRDARIALRLVDADGKTLWEGDGEGFKEAVYAKDEIGKNLVKNLAIGLLGKKFELELESEVEEAAAVGVETLPGRPVARASQ